MTDVVGGLQQSKNPNTLASRSTYDCYHLVSVKKVVINVSVKIKIPPVSLHTGIGARYHTITLAALFILLSTFRQWSVILHRIW